MVDYRQNFAQTDADSPWKFSASDWWAVIKRTWKSASYDNVNVIAAGVAFFSLLAVFPLISAALSTFSYFADPGDVDGITESVASLLPGDAFAILDNQVESVLSADVETASFGIIVSLGFALLSAGAGIRAMMRAMNVAYEEVETRNPLVFYFFGFLMTIGSMFFVWLSSNRNHRRVSGFHLCEYRRLSQFHDTCPSVDIADLGFQFRLRGHVPFRPVSPSCTKALDFSRYLIFTYQLDVD